MAIEGLDLEQIGQLEIPLRIPEPKRKKKGACEQTQLCPFKGEVVCMCCGKHICKGHQRRYKGIVVPFCESCRPNSHEARRMMWAYYGEFATPEFASDRDSYIRWIKGAPDWLQRIRKESPR